MSGLANIDVVILAGGIGTRLKAALPPGVPKVLAPVRGQPFLPYLIRLLYRRGLRKFLLALGYGSQKVSSFIGSHGWPGGVELREVTESQPLGTGGALRNALSQTASNPIIVVNGDTVADIDYAGLLDFHGTVSANITIALAAVENVGRYGKVKYDANGRVTMFAEKNPSDHGWGEVNAGAYVMNREAIREFPQRVPLSLEREILPNYCGRGLYAYRGCTRFIDIGTPDALAAAAEVLQYVESAS